MFGVGDREPLRDFHLYFHLPFNSYKAQDLQKWTCLPDSNNLHHPVPSLAD